MSFPLIRTVLGVGELDQTKPSLLRLKYHAVDDAMAALGNATEIRAVFNGFQEHLYVPQKQHSF
jgi:hypothetical protein